MPNFIGIGAQRTATSWLYSCLYEHPDICAPEKEIHFFSRPRYEEKGTDWYRNIFEGRCSPESIKGEFSTSYLYHETAAERIKQHFPEAKILVSLREPAARAFSQYGLYCKIGEVDPSKTSFEDYIATEPSALGQSRYYQQLKRYFDIFPREQIHVILHDDVTAQPESVLRELFSFLGVADDFVPSFLQRKVNNDRTPKMVWIDQFIHRISEFMYKNGLDKVLFAIKKTGLPELIRSVNSTADKRELAAETKAKLQQDLYDDVVKTGELIGVDLISKWKYEKPD